MKKSFVQVAKSGTDILTGANAIPVSRNSVFTRLDYQTSSEIHDLDESPPMSPRSRSKEIDLADAGYTDEDIETCKLDHIDKLKKKHQPAIPVNTVFQRLKFPANHVPPAMEKMTGMSFGGLNLKFEPSTDLAQSRPISEHSPRPSCTRCLQDGHFIANCPNPIHCRYSLIPGHIYRFCRKRQAQITQEHDSHFLKNQGFVFRPKFPGIPISHWKPGEIATWFRLTAKNEPAQGTPPTFTIFTQLGIFLSKKQGDPSPSSVSPSLSKLQTTIVEKLTTNDGGTAGAMANFPVDPAPFLPGRFDIIEVPGHPQQCRYHVIGNLLAKNEDVAIVTIDNLLAFLDGHLGIRVDYMQRSTLGHAIIRFTATSDKDWLVLHGPHLHNGIHYVFTEHNGGINWRAFAYNREVWLMLLNLPLDLWETAHVNVAVAKWGKLISWDKTVSNLTRAVIKVSHGNDFSGESWTVPVFILSQRLMGLEPPEEDVPPDNGIHHTPYQLCHFTKTMASMHLIRLMSRRLTMALIQHFLAPQPFLPEMNVNDAALQVPPVFQGNEDVDQHNVIVGRAIIPQFVHSVPEFPALHETDIHQPQMEKIHISDHLSFLTLVHLRWPLSVSLLLGQLKQVRDSPHPEPLRALVTRARKPPLVITEVRRSPRLADKYGGYKHKTCINKHCLACAAQAPKINHKIVRSLSERFGLVAGEFSSNAADPSKKIKKKNDDATPTKKQKKK
ncbi:hypothetical protein BRADI_2g25616v3 [Brachypodium distachyon]|uniref:DUF7597 domain-containing protein n=1 Tax=Brachypodium distachyon TaxID=15368 RepID=A0A2K2DAH7_BRADI|nr:hypothetical protein BRADI_2g25616v3 [Brachypodium distachyon]